MKIETKTWGTLEVSLHNRDCHIAYQGGPAAGGSMVVAAYDPDTRKIERSGAFFDDETWDAIQRAVMVRAVQETKP